MLAETADLINSDTFLFEHRVDVCHFIRRRTLTLPMLIACLAQGFIKGLQSELDDFFGRLSGKAAFARSVTKSAFSQARKKLRPSAFVALNSLLLERWYSSVDAPRWHGFRLLAGDTTTVRVPNLPETVEAFGLHGGGRGEPVPMAMAFGLYDVLSGLMVHAEMHPGGTRDRDLLASSLDQVGIDDLLLLDRGFASYWLLAWMTQAKRHFCVRVDSMAIGPIETFQYRSDKAEEVISVTMPAAALRKAAGKGFVLKDPSFRVRLIRVPLPGGKTEVLATSLLDSKVFPAEEFAALYHQRWRIEECFKLLKCRLAIEHFSGELPDSVRQDFLAKVWLGNLTASLAFLARASLPPSKQSKWIPNLTYAVAALRAVLPTCLVRSGKQRSPIKTLIALIAKTTEWVRPDRHFPRERQVVNPVRHRAYKAIR